MTATITGLSQRLNGDPMGETLNGLIGASCLNAAATLALIADPFTKYDAMLAIDSLAQAFAPTGSADLGALSDEPEGYAPSDVPLFQRLDAEGEEVAQPWRGLSNGLSMAPFMVSDPALSDELEAVYGAFGKALGMVYNNEPTPDGYERVGSGLTGGLRPVTQGE